MFDTIRMNRFSQQYLQTYILEKLRKLSMVELFIAQYWGTSKCQHVYSMASSMPYIQTLVINGQQYCDCSSFGNDTCPLPSQELNNTPPFQTYYNGFIPAFPACQFPQYCDCSSFGNNTYQVVPQGLLFGYNTPPFQPYYNGYIPAFPACQFPRLRLIMKTLFPQFNPTDPNATPEETTLVLYLYDRLDKDGELKNLQNGLWIEDYSTEVSNKIILPFGSFIDYKQPNGQLSRRACIGDTSYGRIAFGYKVYTKNGQALILFERLSANMFFGQERLATCPDLPVIITTDAGSFYDNINSTEAIVIGCFGDLETLEINDLDIFKGRSVHWALLSDVENENIKDTITILDLFEKANLGLSVVLFLSLLPARILAEKNIFPGFTMPKTISTTDVLMYADRKNISVPERLRPGFYGKIDLNRIHSNESEEVESIVKCGEVVLIEETSGVPLFSFSEALTAGVANDGNVFGHKLKNPQKKIQFFVMEDLSPKMAKRLSSYLKSQKADENVACSGFAQPQQKTSSQCGQLNKNTFEITSSAAPKTLSYYKVPCGVNDKCAFLTTALNKENASIVVFDSVFMKKDFDALRTLLATLRSKKTTVLIIQNQSLIGKEDIPDYFWALLDQHIRLLPTEKKKDMLMLEIFGGENEFHSEVIKKQDTGWTLVETASDEDLTSFKNRTQTVEKNTAERKYTL